MDVHPTGSQVIDELLEGGFERGIISTIYGPAGSGKSNMCLLLLTTIEKRAIFIDTEGSFSVDRIKQLMPDIKDLLDRIIILKARSIEQQTAIISKLPDMIRSDVELVVVDGIASQYRAGLAKNVKDVNNQLSQQMNILFSVADEHNIPVVITSQVYADMEGEGVKVVGGDIVKYSSKCMIELLQHEEKRTAKIVKHRFLPPARARNFVIENVGIYEDK